jgi:hypothetical protein
MVAPGAHCHLGYPLGPDQAVARFGYPPAPDRKDSVLHDYQFDLGSVADSLDYQSDLG